MRKKKVVESHQAYDEKLIVDNYIRLLQEKAEIETVLETAKEQINQIMKERKVEVLTNLIKEVYISKGQKITLDPKKVSKQLSEKDFFSIIVVPVGDEKKKTGARKFFVQEDLEKMASNIEPTTSLRVRDFKKEVI